MAVNTETVIAANRFGLGARPGDLADIGDSPREWLFEQVQRPQPLLKTVGSVPTSKEAIKIQQDYRKKLQQQNQQARQNGTQPDQANNIRMLVQNLRPLYEEHLAARMTQALESDASFYERLVHFWSNHFAVSADNAQSYGTVATLEFEAVRPNITGTFGDMLLAVEQHPAMLTYLDNILSIGPNSRVGSFATRRTQNRKVDINENLAREIIELHTLGVDGGYTQDDVTTFAKVITGWTIGGNANPRVAARIQDGKPGEFHFNENLHEPGKQTLLGKTYKQKGVDQGIAVLNDLANHPSTARHIATKLARHFIDDEPPAAAVERISKAFLDSGGNLQTVYGALIASSEAWEEPLAKYKTPSDYILSMYRAIDFTPRRAQQIAGPFVVLGQEPFRPGSPAGWPDKAKDWSGGEALFKRVEMAVTTGNNLGNRYDPMALADAILGPVVSQDTLTAISRAESGAQGIALLFASSEFMRR
jgi:uncharacterized protein (DUF1800 family)